MKIILLTGPGENQRALANRLHAAVPLCHIGHVSIPAGKAKRRWVRSIVSATLARPLRIAWRDMLQAYADAYPAWPDVSQTALNGVNSSAARALIVAIRPDVVLVSGTDLLRPATIEVIAEHGRILNLHTGISPYIKGAPNCTNWALALGEFDLIGNTIMWLDSGIDSGPIVATERTLLDGTESLTLLHRKIMDHAHDLFVRAVVAFHAGKRLPNVPQTQLGEGRLFRSREWDSHAMLRAVFNYWRSFRSTAKSEPRPFEFVALDPVCLPDSS